MSEAILETIEKQAGKLSLHDHIKLMEALVRQLKEKSIAEQKGLEWASLYGLGKGLWEHEDAQEYVKRLREDRLTLVDELDKIDSLFIDTAPIIYYGSSLVSQSILS